IRRNGRCGGGGGDGRVGGRRRVGGKSGLMQCSISSNDEGTRDEGGRSIGPSSDLPQLGDFRAAVFCVTAFKIVQSRAANSSFSQRLNASTCGRLPPRLGRTRW